MGFIGFLPFPETSHIIATFGLAKALKARRHQVTYLIPLDFGELITDQGMDFIPLCEELMPKGTFLKTWGSSVGRKLWSRLHQIICQGELDEPIRQSQVDVLVVDSYAQQMALIGNKVGILTVLLRPTIPSVRDPWVPLPTDLIIPNSFLGRLKSRISWYKYDFQRLLKKSGHDRALEQIAISAMYPLAQIDYRGLSPVLKNIPELILCPEEFDLPRSKMVKHLHYIGTYIDLQRNEYPSALWNKIKQGKPLIYCSLGTLSHRFKDAARFLRVIIDAFSTRQELQLVLSIGAHLNVDDFGSLASNTILVKQAPQIEILKRADVMITHGGLNSIKECILTGTPMIVFPWALPRNAIRVAYHKMGLVEDVKKVSAQQIQKMIDTILEDSSFRIRTELMKKRFIEADASNLGVKAIELVLNSNSTQLLLETRLR